MRKTPQKNTKNPQIKHHKFQLFFVPLHRGSLFSKNMNLTF